jgi:photosystem II stability/assembly factor-like uncharacterized protein
MNCKLMYKLYWRTIIILLFTSIAIFSSACVSIEKTGEKTVPPDPLSSSESQNTIFALQRTNTPTPSPTKLPSSIPTSELWNNDAWRNHFPYGGKITILVVDPIHPEIIYAGLGTKNGGIWKSSDKGINWKRSDNGILSRLLPSYDGITALVIDPSTPSTLYAGLDQGAVFKSVDGGNHWKMIHKDDYGIKSMAVDPKSTGTVYIGTYTGILKTNNGGETWENILEPDPSIPGYISSITVDPSLSSTVYAGTTNILGVGKSGIFASLDKGKSWSFSDKGLDFTDITEIVIDPSQSTTLYAATIQICDCGGGISENEGGVYRSLDGGTSWKRIVIGLTNVRVQSLAIDPKVPSTLFAGTYNGLFISKNGGEDWSKVIKDNSHLGIQSIYINPISPSNMIMGTSRGIFKSIDHGANWSESNFGLLGANVLALAEDPKRPGVIIASVEGSGLYESANNGEGWNLLSSKTILPGYAHTLAIDWSNPDVMYASAYDYGVFKSYDRGASWTDLLTNLQKYADFEHPKNVYRAAYFINIDPVDSTIIYLGTEYGLLLSQNGERGWTTLWSDGMEFESLKMAIDSQSPQNIYVGGSTGLFKKANNSSQWEKISITADKFIKNVVLDPRDSNVIYVSDYDNILKSEDGGKTWTCVYNGPRILLMAIDPIKTNNVYATTKDYLLYSNNGGKDWVNMLLPDKNVNTLIISRTSPAVLYAGTSSGVYSIPLP